MLSPQEKNDRLWATLMHLATFSGYVIPVPGMTVLGPLALWLIKRHDSPFLEDQGKEAVNFNLSFLLYLFLAGLSMLVLIGWILVPAGSGAPCACHRRRGAGQQR